MRLLQRGVKKLRALQLEESGLLSSHGEGTVVALSCQQVVLIFQISLFCGNNIT